MYQIDQSIRIEQTNQDTVIGLANIKGDQSYTLVIPARVKRQIQEYYRRQGLPTLFMVKLFTAGIILILKRSRLKVSNLVIDIEYPGYEIPIMKTIQVHFKHHLDISFSVIGKHSPAHFAAYGVYRHKRRSNHTATLPELLNILHKKDRGL
jgi:hypothetical protein